MVTIGGKVTKMIVVATVKLVTSQRTAIFILLALRN
jgi:hypothetical protein